MSREEDEIDQLAKLMGARSVSLGLSKEQVHSKALQIPGIYIDGLQESISSVRSVEDIRLFENIKDDLRAVVEKLTKGMQHPSLVGNRSLGIGGFEPDDPAGYFSPNRTHSKRLDLLGNHVYLTIGQTDTHHRQGGEGLTTAFFIRPLSGDEYGQVLSGEDIMTVIVKKDRSHERLATISQLKVPWRNNKSADSVGFSLEYHKDLQGFVMSDAEQLLLPPSKMVSWLDTHIVTPFADYILSQPITRGDPKTNPGL